MKKKLSPIFGRVCTAVGVLALAGCSNPTSGYDANVQGTVTIDGELARSGAVTFIPKKTGPVATGVIGADGSFALKIGQGTTAEPNRSLVPSGDYVATVVVSGPPVATSDDQGGPPHTGPRLMADKYADKESSGLDFTIKKGANVFELKLDGPSANPPADEPSATEGEKPGDESEPAAAPADDESAPAAVEAASPDAAEAPAPANPSSEEAKQ